MSISQAMGSPITAEIGGKAYTVQLIRQKTKAALEQACKAQVRAEIMQDKANLTDEEFKLAYGAFLDRVGAGEFSFGGATHRKWMESPAGLFALTGLLFGVNQDDAAALLQNHGDEVGAVLQQVFAESFRVAPVAAE
jgi:hypothetical protein